MASGIIDKPDDLIFLELRELRALGNGELRKSETINSRTPGCVYPRATP